VNHPSRQSLVTHLLVLHSSISSIMHVIRFDNSLSIEDNYSWEGKPACRCSFTSVSAFQATFFNGGVGSVASLSKRRFLQWLCLVASSLTICGVCLQSVSQELLMERGQKLPIPLRDRRAVDTQRGSRLKKWFCNITRLFCNCHQRFIYYWSCRALLW